MTPPAVQPQDLDPGERYEFHRLMRRDRRYRWWRPIAFAATGTGFFIVLSILMVIVTVIMLMFTPGFWNDDFSAIDETAALENMADPAMFSLLMFSLIIMIPAVWLAYLLLGSKPVGLLVSVTGKIRWKWLSIALAASAVIYGIYFAINLLIEALGLVDSAPVPASSIPTNPLFYVILVLLLTPLQCAAEELVFRGALMQIIGSWLKHPLFAILLPVPLFTFGHIYDVYGLLDVAFYAVAAGYLTWRTGGLEAAMAVHIINNTFLFLLGAFGLVDLNASGSDPVGLIFSVLLTVLVTFVVLSLAKRHGIQRTAGPAPQPVQPAMLQPWPMAQPMPGIPPHIPWRPEQVHEPSPYPHGYQQPPANPYAAPQEQPTNDPDQNQQPPSGN